MHCRSRQHHFFHRRSSSCIAERMRALSHFKRCRRRTHAEATLCGLSEERRCVELSFDWVVLDLEQVPRRFGNCKSKSQSQCSRNDAEPNDPSPHYVDGASYIVSALLLGHSYDD
jgi:hypothetical protein